MKKTFFAISAVVCMVWAVSAQTEYDQMDSWLKQYIRDGNTVNNTINHNNVKKEWTNFYTGIRNNVKNAFPVDPAITAELENIRVQQDLAIQQAVAKIGYESYDAYYSDVRKKLIPQTTETKDCMMEISEISNKFQDARASLMQTYNDEFNRRFEAAFVDAVKKLKENSAAMK